MTAFAASTRSFSTLSQLVPPPPPAALSPELAERLAWTLLHSVWQGVAVALLLALALRLLRASAPALRYRVAVLALLVMAAAGPATFWALGGRPMQAVNTRVATVDVGTAISPGEPEPFAEFQGGAPRTAADADDDGAAAGMRLIAAPAPAAPPEALAPASTGDGLRQTLVRIVVLAWAAGVVALSLWRLAGWLQLQRLLRTVRDVGAPWEDRLRALARRLRVSRPVRLAEAGWVAVPSVVGTLRPVVLLPLGALTGLTPSQLEALIAHELAHVRRHDYLFNLVQVAVETLLFYHPAVWWVSGRVREEREHCCDDLAVAASGRDPAAYADALSDVRYVTVRDGDTERHFPVSFRLVSDFNKGAGVNSHEWEIDERTLKINEPVPRSRFLCSSRGPTP